MGNIFAGSEIVSLGIQIEKNGRDFYNTLIKQSNSKEAVKVFAYLAGEEEKHIISFQKILENVEKYEPPESYPGEYFAYLNALAGEHIFTKKDKGEETARKTKNDKEAVELGIGFEKDSIIFYEAMKKVVPESDHKIINELIVQEQKHFKQLTDLKKRL